MVSPVVTPMGENVCVISQASRSRGCLLGGAIGDALGAAVEFDSLDSIRSRFGPAGITDFAPAYGRIGAITDDTQMTLFTAEGLLRAALRASSRGMVSVPSTVSHAYQRWLVTQGESSEVDQDVARDGWLIGVDALHSRRAPGNTCLAALRSTPRGQFARNQSKGCGGVMRVAPAGIIGAAFHPRNVAQSFQWGVEAAALTHGHVTGQLPAGVLAAMIHLLMLGVEFTPALLAALDTLRTHPGHEETLEALEAAIDLARQSPDGFALPTLGQGWVAEEALAIAVYACLVSREPRPALCLAVNHSGDSDSTGAIAGNLLGALLGEEALPLSWRERVELREEIVRVADDLVEAWDWDADPLAPRDERTERALRCYPPH